MRYFIVALSMLMLVACGDNRTTSVEHNGSELPEWYSYPGLNENVGAVGIAKTSRAGLAVQNERAVNNGRVKLARVMEARLKSMFSDFVAEGNEIGTDEDHGVTAEYFESVSKTITSRVMRGGMVRDTYHDEKGNVYVWVVLSDEALAQVANAIVDEVDHNRHAAVRAELRAREALDRLDKEVEAEIERRNSVAVTK